MICDDNATFVTLMKQLFVKQGFDVRTADDGDEGLSLVRTHRPDVLLLDLQMPSIDGISVLEGIKGLDGKRPYTVVISAHEGSEKREQATSLGAQEVWRKPFNASELLGRIANLIEKGVI